jgi:hypothetical protein
MPRGPALRRDGALRLAGSVARSPRLRTRHPGGCPPRTRRGQRFDQGAAVSCGSISRPPAAARRRSGLDQPAAVCWGRADRSRGDRSANSYRPGHEEARTRVNGLRIACGRGDEHSSLPLFKRDTLRRACQGTRGREHRAPGQHESARGGARSTGPFGMTCHDRGQQRGGLGLSDCARGCGRPRTARATDHQPDLAGLAPVPCQQEVDLSERGGSAAGPG